MKLGPEVSNELSFRFQAVDHGHGRISRMTIPGHVCVASLFYNPSFVSHIAAFAKAFADAGAQVSLLLDKRYKSVSDLERIAPVFYFGEVRQEVFRSFTHALICNAAISNPSFAQSMRRRGCKVIYLYHEPTVPIRETWGRQSLSSIARLSISRIFSRATLSRSDLVILPSAAAWRTYCLNDRKFNDRTLEMPLIFDDGFKGLEDTKRRTFSYIGTISQAHGFDQFCEFMKYALNKDLGIEFLIASRHMVVPNELFEQHKDSIALKCGRSLSFNEINACYAQSVCVWNLYRFSTQSGVMANAFMCGTPVIASRTGAFADFVIDGYNGEFADATNFERIAAAYQEIADSFQRYSNNSRQTFLENFYYKSQLLKINQILGQ